MALLDGISLFDDFSPSEKSSIEIFCQERLINQGSYLFKQDEDANAMYIVKSGSFDIIKNGSYVANLQSGEIIGEMAMFNFSSKRNASVIAREDSTVIILLYFLLKDFGTKHPEILEKIKTTILNRNKK